MAQPYALVEEFHGTHTSKTASRLLVRDDRRLAGHPALHAAPKPAHLSSVSTAGRAEPHGATTGRSPARRRDALMAGAIAARVGRNPARARHRVGVGVQARRLTRNTAAAQAVIPT